MNYFFKIKEEKKSSVGRYIYYIIIIVVNRYILLIIYLFTLKFSQKELSQEGLKEYYSFEFCLCWTHSKLDPLLSQVDKLKDVPDSMVCTLRFKLQVFQLLNTLPIGTNLF